MNTISIIVITTSIIILLMLLLVFIRRYFGVNTNNATAERAKATLIQINQMTFYLIKKADQMDFELSDELIKNADRSQENVVANDNSEINLSKKQITEYLFLVDDLKQYKSRIEHSLKLKDKNSLSDLDELLNEVNEKIKLIKYSSS